MKENLIPSYAGVLTPPYKKIGFVAGIYLLLLFPGFFLYHFALIEGILPSILGGWFGPLSLVGIPILVPFLVRAFINTRGGAIYYLTLFVLLVLYTVLWIGIHYFWGTIPQQSVVALENGVGLIIYWVVLFTIGIYVDFDRRWVWRGLLVGFLIMTCLTLVNVNPTRMLMEFDMRQMAGERVASYQGFARSYAVTTILLLAFNRKLMIQGLIFFLGTISLFFIGARSDFYGFLVVGSLWIWMLFWRRGLSNKILVVILLISAIVGFSITGVSGSRQFQIFDLSSSTSWLARIDFLKQGWEAIKASPLFGDYAGQISSGQVGSYIHNGMSAWRQFGLVGFLLYTCMTVVSLILAILEYRRTLIHDSRTIAALFLNVLCIILILVAKSVFWVLPPLAWGLTAGLLIHKKQVSGGQPILAV